jgi:hypothetical protein
VAPLDAALRYNFAVFRSPADRAAGYGRRPRSCAAAYTGVLAGGARRGRRQRVTQPASQVAVPRFRRGSVMPSAHQLGPFMAETPPTEFFIQGITKEGKTFRPSDWSERLAGVMAQFGPGASGRNAYMKYSLYVRPTIVSGIKCVIVDTRLRDLEPMAFDFVMNFARDNNLVVTEACELHLGKHP